MKVVHIRDQYLRVSFIYFLLKGFKRYNHILVCREIKPFDLKIYPYGSIWKTSSWFSSWWLFRKILIVISKLRLPLFNDWWAYYYLLRKQDDILLLHAHMGQQGYCAMPIAKKMGKPLFVTFYGADMSSVPKIKGWQERYERLFRFASGIVVEGIYMKSKMVKLGCPEEKIVISKIGIPIENIHFSLRPSYDKTQILRVFMCATFVPKKGYSDALKTILLLKQSGIRVQCDIVGDGPLVRLIENTVKQYDLQENVILHGRKTLPEIYALANQAHVFFHPSRVAPDGDTEGGAPTIIIEMQALGLPVIATRHADIPNIIPMENHMLAEEGNVEDLVKLFRVFIGNYENWNTISLKGREFVECEHSNLITAQKLENEYARFAQ